MNRLTKVMCGLLPVSFVAFAPQMALAQQNAQSPMVCYAEDINNRVYYFTETIPLNIPEEQIDRYRQAINDDFNTFSRSKGIYTSNLYCAIFSPNGVLSNGFTVEGWKQNERDRTKIYGYTYSVLTDYRPSKDIVPLAVVKAPQGADSGKRDSLIVRMPDEAPRPVARTAPKPAAKPKPAVAAKPAPKKKSGCRMEGKARICKALAR